MQSGVVYMYRFMNLNEKIKELEDFNMTKKYLRLAAGLLLLAGCTNNDFIDDGVNPDGQMRSISTIDATIEGADTRVDLKNGKKVIWLASDYISVFSDVSGAHRYDITSGVGTSSATFAGDVVIGNEFYALSQADIINLDQANHEISFYWMNDVIFSVDGSMQRFMPMFSKSNGNNMVFQQLAGILHFQIKGAGQLTNVSFSGNNGELFCPQYTLNYASNVLQPLSEEYAMSVISDFPKATALLSPSKALDVYISLPSDMVFNNGFSLKVDYISEAGEALSYTQKSTNKFSVKRGEVSTFPAFSVTGEAPEPNNSWTLSLNNKSGAYAEVSYTFPPSDSGIVNWIVNFYDAENPADQTCMVHMAFPGLPHTGGTPSLDMLDGMRFSGDDFHAALNDYTGEEEVLYLISGTKVHFDKDGDTWHIYFEDATAKVSGESTTIDDVDFDYTGTLTVSYQSLINDEGEVVTYLIPNGDVNYSSDWGSWHFNLYDEHGEYNVSFLMSSDGFTNPTVIPTGTFNVDLYVDDMENKYRCNPAPVTIAKNSDGTYTISFSNINIGADGSGDISGVSMTWTGYLDNPNVVNTGEWEWYYAYTSTTLTGAYGYKGIDIVRGVSMEDGGGVHYKLIFTDYDMSKGMPETYNEVNITWKEPFADFVPSFPKNRIVTGYIIHVNQGGGYDHQYQGTNTSEAELTISTAYDGTVTISAPNLIMSPGYGQEGHASTFSFTGKLNDMGVTDN